MAELIYGIKFPEGNTPDTLLLREYGLTIFYGRYVSSSEGRFTLPPHGEFPMNRDTPPQLEDRLNKFILVEGFEVDPSWHLILPKTSLLQSPPRGQA